MNQNVLSAEIATSSLLVGTRRKYKTRRHNIIDKNNVVFIVGMCPNHQRKEDCNYEVFHGNKTGDIVEEIIDGSKNVFLTNVSNYESDHVNKLGDLQFQLGVMELSRELIYWKPIKIICFGQVAVEGVRKALTKKKCFKKFFLLRPKYLHLIIQATLNVLNTMNLKLIQRT